MSDVPDDILHLLQLHQDEALAEAQADRLAAWLEADPRQRAAAAAWIETEALLAQALSDQPAIARRTRELGERRRSGRRRDQIQGIMRRGRQARQPMIIRFTPWLLAAAALVAIAVGLVAVRGDDDGPRWRPDDGEARVVSGPLILSASESGTLELLDGSLLRIDGPAAVRMLATPRHGIALDRGCAQIDAAPQVAGRPLEIITPQGVVSVVGTRFRVSAAGEQTWVGVDEGRVGVAGSVAAIELLANEAASLRDDGAPQRVVAADALRAAWSFEGEGGIGIDGAGATPLMLSDGAERAEGPSGQALRLDGRHDASSVNAPASLRGPAVTIAAWIRTERLGAQGWIAAQGDNYGLAVDRRDGSDDLFLYAHDGVAWPDLSSGDVDITDGRWHHVVGSIAVGGQMQLWLDGRLVAERELPSPIPYTLGAGITVGSMQGQRGFAGDIDEVRFYDRVLSETEIAALAAGAP